MCVQFLKEKALQGDLCWTLLRCVVAVSTQQYPTILILVCGWYGVIDELEPGLFRVPGNKDAIDATKNAFNNGREVVLDDVHDTGGVLKQFLRDVIIL